MLWNGIRPEVLSSNNRQDEKARPFVNNQKEWVTFRIITE
jgi:hypothetical protein